MQSFGSIETYVYGTSKDLVTKNKEIRCNNIINWYKKLLTLMMLQKNIKEHNPNWPEIPDHPYRTLIISGSGSGRNKFIIWSYT